ncbi:MAG: hypothetical protein HUU06_01820, partial [Planctomycetaceae bacterium]|nr:hypothetical protein [Planctomycetaceae bacterium]
GGGGGSAASKDAAPAKPAEKTGAAAGVVGDAEMEALLAKYRDVLDLPVVRYEWDRNAGDPKVSAADGGPGFTGEGWETCLDSPTTAWKDAPKGGTMRQVLLDWPATLRLWGENYNSSFNYTVVDLCLEGLVGFHPLTQRFVPSVATHWRISEDRQTYTFRINPEARWSDGKELTSADVLATWDLRMDEKCRFPSGPLVYGKFERPVAKSKYIVEVKCKEDNWRNFLYFGGMPLLPAHEVGIPGDQYLEKFQNAYHAVSGPYMVRPEDVKMGQSIAITRRKDWWGERNPANAGGANIDRFEFEVVKDINLAFEKAKKGEIDYFPIGKAQWWVEEVPKLDPVKRGLLLPKKIYNDAPVGTNGIAINTKKAPLDDRRIRLALQHLYNRRLMIQKFYYNEYEPLSSYESGVYANPENAVLEYDEMRAVELLEEAGWTGTNAELYRVKDGRELKFQIVYSSPLSERNLTKFQEDCKKAGIRIELQLLTPASLWKQVTQKEYELASMSWGGLSIPNPETSWKGELADSLSNNNITGFKNARVDQLLVEYDRAYDPKRRIAVIREIDALVYADIPYVLGWFNPAQRFVIWNKYGMPPWGCSKIADLDNLWYSFWVDPAKEKALKEAMQDSSKSLPREEEKNFFWRAWNERERRREKGAAK